VKNDTIRVYEYGWLVVDEKYGPEGNIVFRKIHFILLAKYLTQNSRCNYYSIYLDRIKFLNYVGVIKVGNLTIEVLPKTDRHEANEDEWQKVLLQMLAISLDVKAKTTTHADIILRKHSVLEAYLYLFLQNAEILLHSGLVKKYRTDTSNQNALKGKLLFNQQVSKNAVHAERFYVAHQVYDKNNVYNAIIEQTLCCITTLKVSESLTKQASRLLLDFPECTPQNISSKLFEKLVYDRKTERYRTTIELARIILLNYHPDIKGGSNSILAIMFDMNILWESYIFRMLSNASHDPDTKCQVLPQRSVSFWQHPDKWSLSLIPDLLVKRDGKESFVLDTKWKYKSDTSMEDVRQLYAYGNYFEASRRYLLYPDRRAKKVEKLEGSFYDTVTKNPSTYEKCGLIFIDLLNQDKTLNLNIGFEILSELF